MLSCRTLADKSVGVTECLVTWEATKIEAWTMLPLLWTDVTSGIDCPILFAATHGDDLFVPWDPGVWLPKYGENLEAIECLSLAMRRKILTAISIERWRAAFGIAIHLLGAAHEDVMAVIDGEGERTVLKAAYINDMATANTEYGIGLRVASRNMLGTMTLGTADDCATAALEDEWTAVHCMSVEVTAGFGVDIYGADTHPDFGAAVHMGEAAPVDNTKIAFGGCTWRGRAAVLRTVLHYPEVVFANIRTTIQRVEALDSLGMH